MSQTQTTYVTSAGLNQTKVIANKAVTGQTSTGVRMGGAVNLTTIAGKPMILTSSAKSQGQHQVGLIDCYLIFKMIFQAP